MMIGNNVLDACVYYAKCTVESYVLDRRLLSYPCLVKYTLWWFLVSLYLITSAYYYEVIIIIIIIIILLTMWCCHRGIVIARVHTVHLMKADWALGGRQPSDQTNRFGNGGLPWTPPSSAIVEFLCDSGAGHWISLITYLLIWTS